MSGGRDHTRTRCRSECAPRLFAGLAALAALALGPAARAQEIDGVVVDLRTGVGVEGARLWLHDTLGATYDSARSDAAGRFRLRAPEAGLYLLSVRREGYADITSPSLEVGAGEQVAFRMELPPTSLANLRDISDALAVNERLRRGIVPACRGRLRPGHGILVGVVRTRRGREPVAGARVRLLPPDGGDAQVTVTDAGGAYLFCAVPPGVDMPVEVFARGFRVEAQPVEVRAGTIAWYDFRMRPAG
ncbi:MAG: carboxypeptidase regulatory-like domain-containing protein [Gemmatimonadetes bacterium]|nr:MAG: carboxypeptidase regulatory-like domain-containing protein [Gemmatimonadota bacterium]